MKTLILGVVLVSSICIFSSCNKCDDPKRGNSIYKSYNPLLDSILQYYSNKNTTIFYTGSDTLNLIFQNNYQQNTIENYNRGGIFKCEEYYYRVSNSYYISNKNNSWSINLTNNSYSSQNTLIDLSIQYSFNQSLKILKASLDVNSKRIDSLINGKTYSNIIIGDIINNQKTDIVIGKVLLNKDFGILAIKTDSLNLIRIP